MILTPHILAGALIGARTNSLSTAFIFGLVSHYLLDQVPHWDYNVKKVEDGSKNFQAVVHWLKIGLDFLLPFLIFGLSAPDERTFFLSLSGATGAALPDFLMFLSWRVPSSKILNSFETFHHNNHTKIKLGLSEGLVSYAFILALFFILY